MSPTGNTSSAPEGPRRTLVAKKGEPDVYECTYVASTVTVETWENQRKIPAVGWKAAYLPTDPPTWSSYGQPFQKLNKEARAFELPSNEWEWTSEWQVDTTLNAKDAAASNLLNAGDYTGLANVSDFDINVRAHLVLYPRALRV